MASQHFYHSALKHKGNAFLNESDDYFTNLDFVSPALISTTKKFINYYYDYIHSEIFNVKNSAYYNQLTRSNNFLNNEILNNFTNDVPALASINNLNIPNISSVPSYPEDYLTLNRKALYLLKDDNTSYLNKTLNTIPKFYELSRSIINSENANGHGKKDTTESDAFINKNYSSSSVYQYLNNDLYRSLYGEEERKEKAIKELIALNSVKNEKIIKDNLKKSYEKNIYSDYEKLKLTSKSISHNSLHLIPKHEELKTEKQQQQQQQSRVVENLEKNPIPNKPEVVEDYISRPNYVFGYGSLINPDSRGNTVDSTKSAKVIKVLAKGLERSWNYNCRDTYTAVGVSRVDDKSIACNGVIIPIDDPVNDLPKLDYREHDYRRVQLSREDIEIIHDSRNMDMKDDELLPPNAIVWVYAIVDSFTPTTEIPISQIYIDCILMGCIKEGGIEFAKQFIENTHGWNTSVWVNDRTSEHFRKNISCCIIKLTDEIIYSIDSLLTTNLCIDVNKRIIPAY